MGSIGNTLSIVTFAVIFFICVNGYQIAIDELNLARELNYDETIERLKRQVETFDSDDYAPTANENQQEDAPGFWERVVNVAIKLFSRFVEWLNAS